MPELRLQQCWAAGKELLPLPAVPWAALVALQCPMAAPQAASAPAAPPGLCSALLAGCPQPLQVHGVVSSQGVFPQVPWLEFIPFLLSTEAHSSHLWYQPPLPLHSPPGDWVGINQPFVSLVNPGRGWESSEQGCFPGYIWFFRALSFPSLSSSKDREAFMALWHTWGLSLPRAALPGWSLRLDAELASVVDLITHEWFEGCKRNPRVSAQEKCVCWRH